VFETPADYERKHFAADLKSGIDAAVQDEKAGVRPQGMVDPNLPDAWNRYWNERLKRFRANDLSQFKHYRGPDGQWFADYIIFERRRYGLPELRNEE
jgi:hypothetical protein